MHDRQLGHLRALENAVDVLGGAATYGEKSGPSDRSPPTLAKSVSSETDGRRCSEISSTMRLSAGMSCRRACCR